MKHTIFREKNIALVSLTIIAIVAMCKLTDPENVVINVIVGICGFIGGAAMSKRKADR